MVDFVLLFHCFNKGNVRILIVGIFLRLRVFVVVVLAVVFCLFVFSLTRTIAFALWEIYSINRYTLRNVFHQLDKATDHCHLKRKFYLLLYL